MSDARRYIPLIKEAARTTGVDFWLLYGVIEQESGFDPNAESVCGALGLMQLMPASFPVQSRKQLLDPELNVRLGAEHLRGCIGMWKQEAPDDAIQFGLASYNGGVGYVLAAQSLVLEDGGDPHTWAGIAPRLAAATYGGRHCDAGQMAGYVAAIWPKYAARRGMPVPCAEQ